MINGLTKHNFDFEISGTPGVYVVRFSADWCLPCRAMSMTFKEVSTEMADRAHFAEVDIDRSPELAARFLEQRTPAILVFKNGRIVERMDIMVPKRLTIHAINKNLN